MPLGRREWAAAQQGGTGPLAAVPPPPQPTLRERFAHGEGSGHT
jgi:hypothetical protein